MNALIGKGIVSKLPWLIDLGKYSGIFVITDETVDKYCFQKLADAIPQNLKKIVLPAGEQFKTIKSVGKVWQKLLSEGCDRKALIINLGGGVIGDLGGFAASTYMRGIPFFQIPTTLLAQVDSSTGGKTGINFSGVKNLVGSFNQPIGVICDIDFLSTLPDREFIEGFGEIIKNGAISDKKYFEFVSGKKPRSFTQEELIKIVMGSVEIKAKVVTSDEKEKDIRKLLNFGHTIGHAIESLSQESNKPLLHGEAIAVGMVLEGKISNLVGLLSDSELKELKQAIIRAGLPTAYNLPVDEILEKMKSDKKNEKGEINWTLLKSIGHAIFNQKVPDEIVRKVL